MAIGASTFTDIGGAVSDIFGGFAQQAKAKGDVFEKENYLLAASLAEQNKQFAEQSTAIKEVQADRELYKSLGATTADVTGAGLSLSGSALDILRDSASQGALTHGVLAQQGLISEAGYEEQAKSYQNMAQAAQVAIDAEKKASTGSFIAGGLKLAAGIATLFL